MYYNTKDMKSSSCLILYMFILSPKKHNMINYRCFGETGRLPTISRMTTLCGAPEKSFLFMEAEPKRRNAHSDYRLWLRINYHSTNSSGECTDSRPGMETSDMRHQPSFVNSGVYFYFLLS